MFGTNGQANWCAVARSYRLRGFNQSAAGEFDKVGPARNAVQHIDRAQKRCDETVAGTIVELLRCPTLAEPTGIDNCNPIGKAQGLFLIVGYDKKGNARLTLNPLQFKLHFLTQTAVERAQWFVEQE